MKTIGSMTCLKTRSRHSPIFKNFDKKRNKQLLTNKITTQNLLGTHNMHMARDCVDRVVGDTSVVAKVYGIAKRLLPPT